MNHSLGARIGSKSFQLWLKGHVGRLISMLSLIVDRIALTTSPTQVFRRCSDVMARHPTNCPTTVPTCSMRLAGSPISMLN
ncbi:MAG: hypothetical protein ACLFQI_10960, partial [Halochromatium sp.]|uniref:hypothetical protein n=1 Tax=Halochromatium sp. TaxID=2049430 RepID=UPI00397AE490